LATTYRGPASEKVVLSKLTDMREGMFNILQKCTITVPGRGLRYTESPSCLNMIYAKEISFINKSLSQEVNKKFVADVNALNVLKANKLAVV
jgi:hypothetical protein